jgi:hypothetical protein
MEYHKMVSLGILGLCLQQQQPLLPPVSTEQPQQQTKQLL